MRITSRLDDMRLACVLFLQLAIGRGLMIARLLARSARDSAYRKRHAPLTEVKATRTRFSDAEVPGSSEMPHVRVRQDPAP